MDVGSHDQALVQSVFERTAAKAKHGLFGVLFVLAKDIAASNVATVVSRLAGRFSPPPPPLSSPPHYCLRILQRPTSPLATGFRC